MIASNLPNHNEVFGIKPHIKFTSDMLPEHLQRHPLGTILLCGYYRHNGVQWNAGEYIDARGYDSLENRQIEHRKIVKVLMKRFYLND